MAREVIPESLILEYMRTLPLNKERVFYIEETDEKFAVVRRWIVGTKMNFLEAVKAMKEGKKVRREVFSKSVFYKSNGYTIENDAEQDVLMDMENIQATDWKIYEETYEEHIKHCDSCEVVSHIDNWNLADNKASGIESRNLSCYKEQDIETFIQKVKEDIDKVENDLGMITQLTAKEIINKRLGDL